jgi:glycosyltransferase involved in cell wall biosynthesis
MALSVLAVESGRLDRPTAEQLAGLVRAGVAVTVAGVPGDPRLDQLLEAGAACVPVPIRARLDPRAIRGLRQLVDQVRPDVVHAFNATALGCALLATRGRTSKIAGFRGYAGHVSALRPSSWLGYLHPRVDRIICVSRAVERFFLDLRVFGRPIAREKIVTIYKGHEPEWYDDPPADLAEFAIPPGAFTIGYCGRDRPRKGIHLLIEAAGLLDRDWPLHYLLVGRMDGNEDLRRRIAASPARDRIHLTGFRTDAPRIVRACDVFALPSIQREGLSRAVFEAMAQGVPAIVSDAGGLPEQVEHGVSGLVVPQSDPGALAAAIAQLYRDRARCTEMGHEARRRVVEQFSCRRTVRETLGLYEQLTGRVALQRSESRVHLRRHGAE